MKLLSFLRPKENKNKQSENEQVGTDLITTKEIISAIENPPQDPNIRRLVVGGVIKKDGKIVPFIPEFKFVIMHGDTELVSETAQGYVDIPVDKLPAQANASSGWRMNDARDMNGVFYTATDGKPVKIFFTDIRDQIPFGTDYYVLGGLVKNSAATKFSSLQDPSIGSTNGFKEKLISEGIIKKLP
jgi:hypothetical protein